MENTLQLEILPSNNPKVILVKDTSFWAQNYVVSNLILEIKAPGSPDYSKKVVEPGFLEVINCSFFDLCCGEYSVLADGIYSFRFSYNPNLKTMVNFYHLRTTEAVSNLMHAYCELRDSKCNISPSDYQAYKKQILDLLLELKGAQWMVEERMDPERGLEMFNSVVERIKTIKGCHC